MNRILFRADERRGDAVVLTGDRLTHIRNVLKLEPGDQIKVGQIGAERYNSAKVLEINSDRCVAILGQSLKPLPRSGIDLLLALPRPKCMRRLWPQIAALGPERVFITAAEKVEKSYWGSSYIAPDVYEPAMLEGLSQSGDTILPRVEIHRRLKPLLQDVIPTLYPPSCRWVAHPLPGNAVSTQPFGANDSRPILIAVGPEGGWSDFELRMFDDLGFRRYSLGERILRTDTAVVSLLSRS